MLFVALVLVLPLSLRPTINSLHMFMLLSVVLFALVVLGVVVICSSGITDTGATGTVLAKLDIASFQGVSIVIFAFANTPALLPIYIEMERPTQGRMMVAQGAAASLVAVLYILSGSLSYAYFGPSIQGNMLNNLPSSTVAVLMQLAFGFGIATAVYPMTIFPCRLAVEHLLLGVRRQFTVLEFSAITLLLVAASLGLAAATTNIALIFGLLGSVAYSLICFVFPALVFLKSIGFNRAEDGKLTRIGVYWVVSAVLVIALGVCGLVLGLVSWAMTIA
jgi:sodium-coupled neutral amino acid transporter 11